MSNSFGRKTRRKPKSMELDITSLLDILVILLVFLLKSYNASDLKLDLVKGLTLPASHTRKLGNHSITVQVNKDQTIWIQNKVVGTIKGSSETIMSLYSYLNKEKEKEKESNITTYNKHNKTNNTINTKTSKKVNLVFDKELPYSAVKKVMHTCASVGLTEFKLIVKGNF